MVRPSDVQFVPQKMPDPAAPNNVLAPFWTDLNGTHGGNGGGDGLRAGTLTDGVNRWLVVEWDLAIFGAPTDVRSFQVWIGLNGTEDISFVWNQTLTATPALEPGVLAIGAENSGGLGGFSLDDAARRLERLRRPAGGEHAQYAGRVASPTA